ncbi:unnamed protein product, partial [marine sediment metagenome]
GTSISTSTIQTLIERKTSFIFSTHMHSLPKLPMIKELPEKSLRISHLVLRFDEESNKIIYDRKLQEGPGNSIYGLEVAMSLSIDSEFLRKANNVRKYILNEQKQFLSTKRSNYNGKLYMDSCIICGSNDIEKMITHHNKEQHLADGEGFINTMPKNILSNLSNICEDCHIRLHNNGLEIITIETSKGIEKVLNITGKN